jgi:hypothetical protein
MANDRQPLIECITPVGKLNYVYINKPEPDDNGVEWYKLTIGWPKSMYDTGLKELRAKAMEAIKQKWPNRDNRPRLQPFLRDGDNPDHNSGDVEELYGKYYFTAKVKAEKGRPGCVDAHGNEISPLDIYSGCEARISVLMGAYDNKGKRGVWVRLQNIQKARDGERIGGRPSARKQFGKLDGIEDDDEDLM